MKRWCSPRRSPPLPAGADVEPLTLKQSDSRRITHRPWHAGDFAHCSRHRAPTASGSVRVGGRHRGRHRSDRSGRRRRASGALRPRRRGSRSGRSRSLRAVMAYELVWARSRMNRNRTLYGSSLGGGTGFMIENLEEDDAAVPAKPVFTEPTPPANAAHVRSMALFFTRRVAGRSAPPRGGVKRVRARTAPTCRRRPSRPRRRPAGTTGRSAPPAG
jgi:hypothetical protein